MSSTYLSPSLKHTRSNNDSCTSVDLGSVGVRKVGISFSLLSALLAGLLLQHTLHASICFSSCNQLGSHVVRLKYWWYSSWKKILANKQNPPQLLKNNSILPPSLLLMIYKAGHPLPLLLLEQPANVHWFTVNMSVSHTYQEPPPQVQLLPIKPKLNLEQKAWVWVFLWSPHLSLSLVAQERVHGWKVCE